MDERETQKLLKRPRKYPVLLLRLIASAGLVGMTCAMVVPWATAQRGNASVGGEYLVVLAAFVLPFCIFRR